MCPNDNVSMTTVNRQGVEFDMCPHCRGVWLDRGELEKILSVGRDEDAGAAPQPRPMAPQPQPWGGQPQQPAPRGMPFGFGGERGEQGERGEYGERGEHGHGGHRRRGSIFDIFD